MEVSISESQDHEDIPIPINMSCSYNSGHMMSHVMISSSAPHEIQSNGTTPPLIPSSSSSVVVVDHHVDDDDHDHVAVAAAAVVPYKKLAPPPPAVVIKYRECLKNHAASMGGNATDGCGEFMPSGEEGTIEALTCSACNCHRNFHRKDHTPQRKLLLGQLQQHHHHHKPILGLGYPTPAAAGTTALRSAPPQHYNVHPHQMIMTTSYNMGPINPNSESDEQEQADDQDIGRAFPCRPAADQHSRQYHHTHYNNYNPHRVANKKRFRTKFSQEQKDKMLNFAEKVGWRFQKQEESIVQQFCQEIGVKRRVLKVWMHNNKHSLAKKNNNDSSPIIDHHHHHHAQTNSSTLS